MTAAIRGGGDPAMSHKLKAAALIAAFEATTKDPAFLDVTAQHKMEVAPVSGKRLAEMLTDLYRTPEPILAKARIAIAR